MIDTVKDSVQSLQSVFYIWFYVVIPLIHKNHDLCTILISAYIFKRQPGIVKFNMYQLHGALTAGICHLNKHEYNTMVLFSKMYVEM